MNSRYMKYILIAKKYNLRILDEKIIIAEFNKNINFNNLFINTLAEFDAINKKIYLYKNRGKYNTVPLYKKFNFQEIGRYPQMFNVNQKYYDALLMNLYID